MDLTVIGSTAVASGINGVVTYLMIRYISRIADKFENKSKVNKPENKK